MIARLLLGVALTTAFCSCYPRRDWSETGLWVDSDGDGTNNADDCEPHDPGIHPGALESCNGVDDDCDDLVDDDDDEVYGTTRWSFDDDGDGYGDSAAAEEACEVPEGAVSNATDCDDTDADVNPAATELCDGVDNDCDGGVDLDAEDAITWYLDEDADGYGVEETTTASCELPSGHAEVATDCDDADSSTYPGAEELCDGVDNDCDEETDEGVDSLFYRDRDGDGYGDAEITIDQCPPPSGYVDDATDCDDGDEAIHPEADEYCDGVDYDCDDVNMEPGSVDVTTWYADVDEDGYGDPDSSTDACEQPPDYVADDTDCDDGAAAINPAAYDFCDDYADKVDDDCDGTLDNPKAEYEFHLDEDGDGYGAVDVDSTDCAPPEGTTTDDSDCDDSVTEANPDGTERYAWGIDYDCDGDLVHDDGDAQALLVGEAANDWAGDALPTPGDYDGDGRPDLVVNAWGQDSSGSSAGAVYVLFGGIVPTGETDLSAADVKLFGVSAGDAAGKSVVTVGDVDGDGLADMAIGAPGNDDAHSAAGVVYLATGAWIASGTASLDLDNADGLIFGDVANAGAGTDVAAAGDHNHDGLDDLLVGCQSRSSSTGAVYLVTAPDTGEIDLSMATASLMGESTGDTAGPSAGGGDIDGDGQADIIIGASENQATYTQGGRVYCFLGPVSGTMSLDEADVILEGEADYAFAGRAVGFVGDIDGDGLDDATVSSPGRVSGSWTMGTAYLVSGATLTEHLDEVVSLAGSDATFEGEASSDNAGYSVAAGCDVDGDSTPDFLVSAYSEDSGASDGGALYIVPGPVSGTEDLASSWIKISSDTSNAYLGSSVTFTGDLDGDALIDFLVGVPGDNSAHTDAGAAWLFLSGDL